MFRFSTPWRMRRIAFLQSLLRKKMLNSYAANEGRSSDTFNQIAHLCICCADPKPHLSVSPPIVHKEKMCNQSSPIGHAQNDGETAAVAAKGNGKSGERIPFPKYPRSVSDTCLPFLVLLLLAFFGPCEERKNPFTSVSGGGLLLREMHGFKRRIHACYVRSPIPSSPSRASRGRYLCDVVGSGTLNSAAIH